MTRGDDTRCHVRDGRGRRCRNRDLAVVYRLVGKGERNVCARCWARYAALPVVAMESALYTPPPDGKVDGREAHGTAVDEAARAVPNRPTRLTVRLGDVAVQAMHLDGRDARERFEVQSSRHRKVGRGGSTLFLLTVDGARALVRELREAGGSERWRAACRVAAAEVDTRLLEIADDLGV